MSYIVDSGNNRVQVINSEATPLEGTCSAARTLQFVENALTISLQEVRMSYRWLQHFLSILDWPCCLALCFSFAESGRSCTSFTKLIATFGSPTLKSTYHCLCFVQIRQTQILLSDFILFTHILTRRNPLPSPPRHGWFLWLIDTYNVSAETIYKHHGLDAWVYIKFLDISLKLVFLYSIYGCIVIILVNSTPILSRCIGKLTRFSFRWVKPRLA